jgi:hypothetical protein
LLAFTLFIGVHNLLAMREDIPVIVNPSGGAERDGGDNRVGGEPAETLPNAALLAEIALVR